MAKRQETDEPTIHATGEGRWLVVQSLLDHRHTIPPDNRKVEGKEDDLVLDAHGFVALPSATPWLDDYNLERAVEEGTVAVYRTARRPKPLPMRPPEADLHEPRYNAMIREIVFGKAENAKGFIGAEPRYLDRPGEPLNKEWLKDVGWRVLHGAKRWLQIWGPPESESWRLSLIDERIEEIRRMP